MATLEIDPLPRLLSAPPITASPFRHVRRRRKRLALISSHDDLCGIAAYTRSLEKQLSDVFEVTVFDLDQYLLRSTHGRVRKFGDRHILDICREIRDFEVSICNSNTAHWAEIATTFIAGFPGSCGPRRGSR
jgi:hypothetical protein